jgi:uncharacterized protein
VMMDARPSDAIALALRADCPVYVSEQVMRSSRVSGAAADNLSPEELQRWLQNLNDEDLGRYKM